MYDDSNWTAVTGDERARFLKQFGPIDGKHALSLETAIVEWRPLPFYEKALLVRLRDAGWTPVNLAIWYLTLDGDLYRLNGTSPPIHEVNAVAPVRLTEDNILDYLRFFCFFVHGDDGPFLIAEDINDPAIPADMDADAKEAIEESVRPASYKGRDERDCFLCEGVVFHGDMLSEAHFAIWPSGMVEMLDDEPIAGELGVKPDAPIA